jgi:drug/metabolite transporter (DMT)-like permease
MGAPDGDLFRHASHEVCVLLLPSNKDGKNTTRKLTSPACLHSLKALPLVAVATTIVFRNLGTVFVAIGDSIFFGKEFNAEMKQGIGIILCGSLVYSYFDMDYNAAGYMWMSCNTVIFAINVLYEKYAVVSVDQTAVGVSCYQNLLSLPLLTLMLVSSGEHVSATGEWGNLSASMQGTILLTGVFGCLLSICYMSLNKFASPTAITIASNLNKLVSAIVGALVFHNSVSPHTVFGLLICMAGGYHYANAPKIQSKGSSLEEADIKAY